MSPLDCLSVAEVIGACSYAVVRGWLEVTYRIRRRSLWV